MTAYAIATLRDVETGSDIVAYLERIDATLAPFGARWLVHGRERTVLEGSWPDATVVLAFPGREEALSWYGSEAYRAILPLRTRNSRADVVLIEGVPEDHRATDVLG